MQYNKKWGQGALQHSQEGQTVHLNLVEFMQYNKKGCHGALQHSQGGQTGHF